MRYPNTVTFAIAVVALALGAALAAGSAAAKSGAAPASVQQNTKVLLRESVEVEASLVKLGDLFSNAGVNAEVEVAYAPEPGKRAVFDAHWLYRVARSYQLPWRPLSEHVRSVVTRRSVVIDQREIEEMILDALVVKGADANSELDMNNRLMRLHVPADAAEAVRVEETSFDPRSRRFHAIIAAPSGKGALKRIRVRGRLFATVEVPVLNRRVLAGEVISAKDIRWLKLRASRMQTNTVTSDGELVGHTPKRGLRAGYPVLASAVRRPILVPKGSLVTMLLRTPQMLLTAQGKALENGSDGDVIRISNSQSKTVIEAEVIGDGKVAVRPSTLVAMN